MAEDPKSRTAEGLITVLPTSVTGPTPQNPAPFAQVGQVDESRVRAVADQILLVFRNSLPSNYVSQVGGPNYVQNFSAVAEELARIQVAAEDAFEDTDFDFTRSEVLFQFLGDIIFPTSATTGLPDLDGDLTYREFLQKMVRLLLKGSKTVSLQQGIEALTDAEIEILEKFQFIGQPGVSWGPADRFTFEINVSKHRRTAPFSGQGEAHYHTVSINAAGDGETLETLGVPENEAHTHTIEGFVVGASDSFSIPPHTHDLLSDFADLPIVLESNVRIVLRALRPAHTLYDYRNLFRESFRDVFEDEYTHFQLDPYYYEDFRKNCAGIKEITGSTAEVLSDRYTLNDAVSFRAILPGAPLVITSGVNAGRYEVREAVSFPYGDDPVARPYTTSPTGLTGTATVVDGAIVDSAQDWALAAPGEVLTFTTGANAGRYLLETLLGPDGGPLGVAAGPATEVRPAVSFLRIRGPRFPAVATGISYTVEVDRLGVRAPIVVTDEDVAVQFLSPPAGNVATIRTAHGPLVRSFGDATPATRSDVTVLYDGVPVGVSAVNPYTGEITLAAPIARFAAGAHTVTISYRWFPGPLVAMAGLNTKGLTLNTWSLKGGRTATSPGSGLPGGGYSTSRFPLSVALGRFPRRRPPVRVAHRYIAFERAYTAGLNSPTTLLLNQAPGRVSVPYAYTDVEPTTVQYEGTTTPPSPWTAKGSVTGTATDGLYELTDASTTEVGYWSRDFELPVSSAIGAAARFQIDSYALDGVFTGIGFGFHNDRRLYLAGALVVNGLKHVGLLARPGNLSELSSWIVGPKTAGTVESSTVVTCAMSEAPKLIGEGDRFQILTGSQAGIYTIDEVVFDNDRDLVTIAITGAFPANPALFGNRDVDLVFETEWDAGLCTWRLYANTRSNAAQLMFGGATGGTLTVEASPILASPAYLGPDVLPEGAGRFLWGSFDRAATSVSTWDFVRYLSTPDGAARFSRGTVVDTTMTEDPEDGDWFRTTPYGDSSVSSGALRITSTPADATLDTSYAYGLVDPFLNGRRVTALDAKVTVIRDTSGAGGAALCMKDTHREARLGTILYQDNGGAGKAILPQPAISLVGAVSYEAQGWAAVEATDFGPPTVFANGPNMRITGSGDLSWTLANVLTPSLGAGRTFEFRMAVEDYTLSGSNATGLTFLLSVSNRLITVAFNGPDSVDLITTGPPVTASIPWSDGEPRTYRIEVSPLANTVDLYVNDALASNSTFTDYPVLVADDGLSFGYLAETGASFSASLSSLCFMERLDGVSDVHRTFGIWKGGDFSDIDSWELPRTDGLSVPNSSASSAIVEMDWTTECWVRLFVDPTFGAGFLRPDLAPPAGYTGNFATQSMDPTAAWAKIEYSRLPRAESATRFGTVFFGALNPAASTLQAWTEVRYRVFTHTSIDYRAPQRMTLNRWNVITSGDYLKDVTPESVVIASLTATRISLRSAHLVANRVFHVSIEGVPLATDAWVFNSDSQEITLSSALPSVGYPVTVVFAPGKPITTTYLQSQPLNESQTILNEGTPPVPMSQVGKATVSTVSGDGGPTPAFPPAVPGDSDYFLRDQYLVRKFEDDPDALYEQMEFFQLDDGGATGQLSTFCDSSVGGNGLREVSVSGAAYREDFGPFARPITPASPFGAGPGSAATILYASGVSSGRVLGVLGPATYVTPLSGANPTPTGVRPAMLYPTSGGIPGVPQGPRGGDTGWEVLFVLREGAAPGVVSMFTVGAVLGAIPSVPSNALTTEAGVPLTTEAGDILTTEG